MVYDYSNGLAHDVAEHVLCVYNHILAWNSGNCPQALFIPCLKCSVHTRTLDFKLVIPQV